MNFKFTLVLLAAAIIAVAGFGIAQRQAPPPASSAAPSAAASAKLFDFGIGTVTGIDVKTKDHETALTKDGAKWKLVKPSEDPNVDQTKINALVGQIYNLTSQRPVAQPGEDITPYGLRNPSATLALSAGDKTETLLIGDKNVDGNFFYATRQEGSAVALIPSALVNSVTALATTPPLATPTPSGAASASAKPALPSLSISLPPSAAPSS